MKRNRAYTSVTVRELALIYEDCAMATLQCRTKVMVFETTVHFKLPSHCYNIQNNESGNYEC